MARAGRTLAALQRHPDVRRLVDCFPRPKTSLIFLCTDHQGAIPDTHPLTDEDRAELEQRRDAKG